MPSYIYHVRGFNQTGRFNSLLAGPAECAAEIVKELAKKMDDEVWECFPVVVDFKSSDTGDYLGAYNVYVEWEPCFSASTNHVVDAPAEEVWG